MISLFYMLHSLDQIIPHSTSKGYPTSQWHRIESAKEVSFLTVATHYFLTNLERVLERFQGLIHLTFIKLRDPQWFICNRYQQMIISINKLLQHQCILKCNNCTLMILLDLMDLCNAAKNQSCIFIATPLRRSNRSNSPTIHKNCFIISIQIAKNSTHIHEYPWTIIFPWRKECFFIEEAYFESQKRIFWIFLVRKNVSKLIQSKHNLIGNFPTWILCQGILGGRNCLG